MARTVLPALAFGSGCASRIEIQNLGELPIAVNAEAHRASGALAPWDRAPGNSFLMNPGEALELRAHIQEETTEAWVDVRETVPPASRPSAAVRATTDCVDSGALRSADRQAAYPLQNPWFSADVDDSTDGSVLLLNTANEPATATVCYSAGALYSLPGRALRPVCSSSAKIQVPPFGSQTFALRREGSSHLDLRTAGSAIVLQILRPVPGSTHLFTVDSSISFEGESSHRE